MFVGANSVPTQTGIETEAGTILTDESGTAIEAD